MVILLVATSGMILYKLQCKCLHHEHISVYLEPESCHKATESDCCTNTCNCSKKEHSDNTCDTHEAVFVKLATEFISTDHSVVISPIQHQVMAVLFSDLLLLCGLNEQSTVNARIDSPPPRIHSGQKIVQLLHQFKFDHQSQLS